LHPQLALRAIRFANVRSGILPVQSGASRNPAFLLLLSYKSARLPLGLRPSGLLSLLVRRKITKETHPRWRAFRASCPPGTRVCYGVRWMHVRVHSANGRTSCAASFGPFLRTLAAPQGAPFRQHPAPEATARTFLTCSKIAEKRTMAPTQCRDARIRGSTAPFAVPSIAGVAGNCPQGRGEGSPRLRSSAWMHCLSNSAAPRSAG